MKYTCTNCRQGFNTEPYVLNKQGIFCQRNCWENFLAECGIAPVRPALQTYNGTHIKRR